jgi:uncharacterized coiled-coil DUF342 family protein
LNFSHVTHEKAEQAQKKVEELKQVHTEADEELNKCNEEIKALQKKKADLSK